MMKRLAAAALALVLTFGLFCIPALAANDAQVFKDVKSDDWYYADVMALYEAGVVNGFGDGEFKPSSKVTTGQALKMVLLAAGYSEPDPVASHWARGYLNLALDKGVLDRGDITDLDVKISRVLVAKVAARALSLQKTQDTYFFSDTKDDNVQALYEADILKGYADGTFQPENSLTRAELSAIVNRIYQYKQKQEQTTTVPKNKLDDYKASDISLRTTEAGIDFIKAREGFVSKAYNDYSQFSIGYGSHCQLSEYPDGITETQADILLRLELQDAEKELNAFLSQNGLTLSDTQYDALASFTYNVGSDWMKSGYRLSSLLCSRSYSENDFASAFGIWCHVTSGGTTSINDGLINRRIREMCLFLYGKYDVKPADEFCYLIFNANGGSAPFDIAFYKYGESYGEIQDAKNGPGNFSGWFTDDGRQIKGTDIANDSCTVTAQWEESPT
jgi:GH24 family phage-related lysozyme (muramidase)